MKSIAGIIVVLLSASLARATDPYPKNNSIDISHYHFYLEVNDSTDVIYGEASVSVTFKKRISSFELDLTNKNSGKGMETTEVTLNGTKLNYTHINDKLKINLSIQPKENETWIF